MTDLGTDRSEPDPVASLRAGEGGGGGHKVHLACGSESSPVSPDRVGARSLRYRLGYGAGRPRGTTAGVAAQSLV